MQIRRVALIATIDAALTQHDKAMNEYRRQVRVWKAQRRADWDKESAPRWKALRNTINARMRAGKPITQADVRLSMVNLIDHQFDARDPYNHEVEAPRCPVDRLKSLRSALAAITDDTVTPSSLRSLGYRELEWVFAAAIKNGAAAR